MITESFSELFAIARSSRFTTYERGVPVRLPSGENVVVKIERTSKSVRPVGLRFSTFAFMTEVSAGDARGFGFGEAPTQLIALQKSIAEGVERAIYKAVKGTDHGTTTSNGWAAHINRARALESAVDELVERDAVLVHWLGKIPMKEIAPSTWPSWLLRWTNKELALTPTFNQLRILVSSEGYRPTITTVLINSTGHAVLSHAASTSIERALPKALAETCRIAQIAMEGTHVESSARLGCDNPSSVAITPEDHAMFYAFHEPLPTWLFGERMDWTAARASWKAAQRNFAGTVLAKLNPKFHQVADGPLVVGHATSDLIQSLYFGRTQDAQKRGFINVRRFEEVKHGREIYLMPHCVP
jgi:hypothetical protein